MEVSGFWQVFGCAAFGGLLLELLKWHGLKTEPNFPAYARSPFYWAITAAMIIASGVLGVLYGLTSRNAIMVLNIGVSAPLLIKALAETRVADGGGGPATPRAPGYHRANEAKSDGPTRPGIRSFLAWK